MTAARVSGSTSVDAAPDASHHSRSLYPIGLSLLVLVLAGAATVYDHWLTHPNALLPAIHVITDSSQITIGRTYAADTSLATRDRHDDVIVLDRVRPIITTNTAHATVEMELCRHRPGRLSVGGQLFSTVSRECTSVNPVQHQSIVLSEIDTQLIAVVTARTPGRIWIAGYDVTYHQGRRHETESGGIRLHYTAIDR